MAIVRIRIIKLGDGRICVSVYGTDTSLENKNKLFSGVVNHSLGSWRCPGIGSGELS